MLFRNGSRIQFISTLDESSCVTTSCASKAGCSASRRDHLVTGKLGTVFARREAPSRAAQLSRRLYVDSGVMEDLRSLSPE